MWRKIQTIGFSAQYRDKDSEIGKWLTLFYGLPYLAPEEIEDCFVMDITSQSLMAVTQTPMEHNSHFHIHVWYIIGGRI
jgi:hypothetical protein